MIEEGNTEQESSERPNAPRTVEIRSRTLLIAALVVVAAIAAGVGAFFYGRGTGEDLDAAREAGAQAGRAAGTKKGTASGYAAGFKEGRKKGYKDAYEPAFKESYVEAFEKAGLDAPAGEDIPLPDSSDSD